MPLVGDLYVVSRPLTTYSGEVKAQIIARDPGSAPIALTPNFKMMITPSNYSCIGEDENYPVTNITVGSEELDGYTVFNYPISLANGWNYVKKQLNDNRDYIYDMDLQSAEAYVNSEYAVTLTELEV